MINKASTGIVEDLDEFNLRHARRNREEAEQRVAEYTAEIDEILKRRPDLADAAPPSPSTPSGATRWPMTGKG